jgi:hypothetical protein|tara:strand:+ start:229 stop:489 length:261 start_codon:yes stop_codon:yes gene_type:complete
MGIYKIKIADCDLSAEYSIHEGMASIDGMTPDDSDETVIDSLILSKKDDNGNEISIDISFLMDELDYIHRKYGSLEDFIIEQIENS